MHIHIILRTVSVLAGGAMHAGTPVVPTPAPTSPVGGNGVSLILGYGQWGALIACGLAALVSAGEMAVGQLSSRPEHLDRGKRALLWSLGGTLVAAIAIPTLNTVFSAVHP